MPGLNITILTDDAERFRGALTLAMAQAALGQPVRLFLQFEAVRLLIPPLRAPRDDAHAAQGLPTLAALLDEALESDIGIIACQSGMTLAGLKADEIDPRIEAGGPVSFLRSMGNAERFLAV